MDQPSPMSDFPQEVHPRARRSSKSKKWVVLAILLIFIGSIVFGLTRFFKKTEPATQASSTPTPTQELFPTDTPFPSPTTELTPIPSGQAPTGNPIDKATGLDRSALTVEVQNGSGEVGVGSKGADTLRSFGYHVTSVGNADSFSYETTNIQVKDSKKSYLSLLKKDLGTTYTIGSANSELSASSSADALVIIGKQ